MKLVQEISQYPNDYSLEVEIRETVVFFTYEAAGQPIVSFDMSLEELIKAGELAKKFKEIL